MVMDNGIVPYDSRPVTSAPLSRPVLTPHYFPAPSYSPAPISGMQAPQYQNPLGFDGFASYSPPAPAIVSPYRQQYPDRPTPRIIPAEQDVNQARGFRREASVRVDGSRSPSVKSETQMSVARSAVSTHSGPPRTISTIVPVNPANQISFHTEVDVLVKALQAKKETDVIVKKVEAEQLTQPDVIPAEQVAPTPPNKPTPGPTSDMPRAEGRQNRKRYTCDIADCGKTFFQKTHLDIHKRSHTGDKPYFCKLPGCGSRFSQLGNLKTHERRHTGEKPFQCDQCGKRFAQRGNVRAHLKTHLNTKPFLCRLDDCNKRFTQLGNLKSHQNKFHGKTIKRLTQKFAQLGDYEKASQAERELWEYFATLYKNSNKGIKGRGKDRKVDPGPQGSPMTPKSSIISHAMPPHTRTPAGHYTFTLPTAPPHHGLSHPAAYSMSRPGLGGGAMVGVGHRGGPPEYDMFDVDDGSAVGGGAPSAANGGMYEVDHARELAFGDRIYS